MGCSKRGQDWKVIREEKRKKRDKNGRRKWRKGGRRA